MAMADSGASSAPPASDRVGASSDIQTLRLASLDLALAGAFALAAALLGTVFFKEPVAGNSDLPGAEMALAVCVPAVLAYMFRGRWPTLAAITLLVGLGADLLLALRLYPPDAVAPWLAPLVALATMLLGTRCGIAAAAASSAMVLLSPTLAPGTGVHWGPNLLALAWTVLVISWMTTKPLQTALGWAWNGYERALAKTQELQASQGELAQALKGLSDACYRLEVANLELSRARQAADEARQTKARFAAFLSHELRLPLNVITGFSEMMVMSPESYGSQPLPPAYRGDIEAVYRAAYHLSELVDDVLDLSEIDAHRMGLEKAWISLADVVDQAKQATVGMFEGKGLSLRVEVPPILPLVYADRTRIRQVILNFLRNAARYTDVGGVTLSVSVQDDAGVVVAVADTGIGIAPEDLPRVFEEFAQLDAAGKRRLGGTGLGVTISKRFVEMHGGTVWVESDLGRGSTFSFSLPRTDNVAAASVREPWETWARVMPVGGQQPGPTVAVLGHDRRAIRLLQRYLDGYQVLAVPSLDDLATLADRQSIDTVIVTEAWGGCESDLGGEVAARVPLVPVVACSMHTSESIASSLGVAGYLVKPVDRERIGAALASVGGVERVLVVDDDPLMTRLLATMVRSILPDCQVFASLDGGEALDLIRAQRPQLVLLDLMMPRVDGYEVIRQLHGSPEYGDPAVIVVTGADAVDEELTAVISLVTRGDGLRGEEFVRCLQATLDSLRSSPDPARERRAASAV